MCCIFVAVILLMLWKVLIFSFFKNVRVFFGGMIFILLGLLILLVILARNLLNDMFVDVVRFVFVLICLWIFLVISVVDFGLCSGFVILR